MRTNIPGTLLAGLLLVGLGVGLVVVAPGEKESGQALRASEPVGGEQGQKPQKRTSKAPVSSKPSPQQTKGTGPKGVQSSPQPTSSPAASAVYVTGAPRVSGIRCFYSIGSNGGGCRFRVEIVNGTDATLTSMKVQLTVAPERSPESERSFDTVTTRYQIYAPNDRTEVFFDVPSMEVGFYYLRACIMGYQWLHPEEGWKQEPEFSCEGGRYYAGPG